MEQDDTIKVTVWLKNIDSSVLEAAYTAKLNKEISTGTVPRTLRSKAAYLDSSESITSDSQNITMYDAQTLSSIKRTAYGELFTKQNVSWGNQIIDKLSNSAKMIYSSLYAPVVILELPKSDFNQLVNSDEVEYIYPCDETVITPEIEPPIEAMSTNEDAVEYGVWQDITNISVMKDVNYNGTGVKIGLIENGVPDATHPSGVFSQSNIEILTPNADEAGHATYTASILVGKTADYSGVAPNATLICYGHEGSTVLALDRLTRAGANIINISLGLGDPFTGEYGGNAKLLDFFVYWYGITICKSAGTYQESTPSLLEGSMGYNYITVGNVNDQNTLTYNDDVIASDSLYSPIVTSAYKPDICAPGANVGTASSPYTGAGNGGTSAASPVVAGVCAMLMQEDPSLAVKPMLLKAAIMCSTTRIPNMDYTMSSASSTTPSLSRQYGAGMINATKALNTIYHEKWGYIPLTSDSQRNPYTYNIPVTQDDIDSAKKLSVCLCWTQKVIASSHNNAEVYNVYHHDLGVYDPNGTLVAYSNFQYDRKQLVYFQPTVPGTYQVKVYKTGIGIVSLAAITYNISD